MEVYIGVDASTTGSKAVAFASDGSVRAVGRHAIRRSSPQAGWHEQDAEDWWRSTASALRQVAEELDGLGDRPVAVGITHQRESFVCLGPDFRPLRPAILWLDTRSGKQVRTLGSEVVHSISGKPPSTIPSIYKIAWMACHEPERLKSTSHIADVHAYLSFQLAGSFVTSTASADPMGLLDLSTGTWSETLLDIAGVRAEQLPRIVSPGTIIGGITHEAAERTGLPIGLPVVAGGGDGQCAGLGAGAVEPNRAYLSLGTSITLGRHAEAAEPSLGYRILASLFDHGHTIEAFIATGALSVSWFRQAFPHIPDAPSQGAFDESLDRSPVGARGLMFLPYLGGAGTPHWDDHARGVFFGIDEGHTWPDFYRSVLEGLAYEIRVLLTRLEAAGGSVEGVVVLGGGAASDRWLQIIADVLDRPLLVSATTEATALGAAILAASAVRGSDAGIEEQARAMVRIGRTVHPSAQHSETYRAHFGVYADIYTALAPLFARQAADTSSALRGGSAGMLD